MLQRRHGWQVKQNSLQNMTRLSGEKNGLSGSASSHIGPLIEIHDASTFEGSGALFGFVGVDASTRIKAGEARIKQAAIEQLSRIFGEQAAFLLMLNY